MEATAEDEAYLLEAEALRLRLSKPLQSGFRVVAVVAYTTSSGESRICFGANDEPCHISGSICAERSAFLQLRLVDVANVFGIYIISDAKYPIPPGMLCREYMASSIFVNPKLPIVMAASGFKSLEESRSSVSKLSLENLYPLASMFAREPVGFATEMQVSVQSGALGLETPQSFETEQVWQAAKQMALLDNRTDLHPIRYGAAVMCSDGKLISAFEKKGVEYGCTLCAVTQLAQAVEDYLREHKGITLKVLVQADAAGICHAPFAAARSWLAEFGHDSCRVLVHRQNSGGLILTETSVKDLCPLKDLPIFKHEEPKEE